VPGGCRAIWPSSRDACVTDQALQAERTHRHELAEAHRAELAARDATTAAVRAEHDEQISRLRDTHAAELARLAVEQAVLARDGTVRS
jgi:hypothetical protein